MSITNIASGQAIVQIIGDNSELKKVLGESLTSVDKFAREWTAIGSRLQAAGQMMFAPFQEAIGVNQLRFLFLLQHSWPLYTSFPSPFPALALV